MSLFSYCNSVKARNTGGQKKLPHLLSRAMPLWQIQDLLVVIKNGNDYSLLQQQPCAS